MKNKIKIKNTGLSILAVFMLVLFSCTDFDERPLGIDDPETFFGTQEDAEAVLFATYGQQYSQKYYCKEWQVVLDIASDDCGDGFGGIAQRKEMDRFKYATNYGSLASCWWHMYTIINRAGMMIDATLKMPDNVFDSPELKKRWIAEARFLRAQNYFHLVRMFGDVPFWGDAYLDDPMASTEVTRTEVDVIYKFIIDELIKAEADLWDRTQTEKGRATKGAAQAYLAKVYMTRAGWRLDAEDATMVEGDPERNPDPEGEHNYWAKAAVWTKKMMDEGKYKLMDNYRHVFPSADDEYDTWENNEEHIYFVNCIVSGPWHETLLYYGPRLANGEGAYSSYVGEVELYKSFDLENDKRVDATFLTYVIDEFEEEQSLLFENETYWYPGMAIPHIGKFLPDEEKYTFPPSGNPSGVNVPMFRYAEVLLMHAEATNEVSGPTTEGIEAFNIVRRRAGLSEWPNVADPDGNVYTNDKDGFRKAIRQERRWELCFEEKRYFDLLRWGNLVETFQARGQLEDATPQDIIRAQNVDIKHNLFPIPSSDRQKNPNLTQNPGY